MNRSSTSEHSRSRGMDRSDLILGFLLAAGICLAVVAVVSAIGRNTPGNRVEPAGADDGWQFDTLQTSIDSSQPKTAYDQRLSATRRDAESARADETNQPADQPEESRNGAGTASESRAVANEVKSAAESLPVETPRQKLKQVRKQAQAGQSHEALDSARQIASRLPASDRREKLLEEIDVASHAAAAGQQIDFDSLIQLLQSTIAPNTWDSVGGPGSAQPFPGGVWIDTTGLLRSRLKDEQLPDIDQIRAAARHENAKTEPAQNRLDPAAHPANSPLRMISLPRLEREVARCVDEDRPIADELRFLAGLTDVRYLLVYPETHDIIVAGLAEDWRRDELGRVVGRKSGRPVLQLDDLVVILRVCFGDVERRGFFGCGIYPRAKRLQAVQEFVAESSARPIEPAQRNRWLDDLRAQLGEQDIKIFGVPAGSRVAHVLVEADYRMKLIGIGLEAAAVPDIPNYFELLGQPTPERLARGIDTLRWWFTLHPDVVRASADGDAFELRGNRVQVLSENELLTATGQVVHTGQAEPINEQFARNFTQHFGMLAARDANFADLAGIFDLAIVAGLLQADDLPREVGWTMSTFLDADEYRVPLQPSPRTVESVLNHRIFRGRHIMAAVSGGVHVSPSKVASRDKRQIDAEGALRETRASVRPTTESRGQWWWD